MKETRSFARLWRCSPTSIIPLVLATGARLATLSYPGDRNDLENVWLVFVSAVSVLNFISEYLYNGDDTLRRRGINWASLVTCYK